MKILLIMCSEYDFCNSKEFYENAIMEEIAKQQYKYIFQVIYDSSYKIECFRWMKIAEKRWEQRFWKNYTVLTKELINYSFEKEFVDRLLFIKPIQVNCFALKKDKFYYSMQSKIQDKGINFNPII